MTRRRILPLAGLVAVAALTALAVVGVSALGGDDEGGSSVVVTVPDGVTGTAPPPGSGLPEEGIEARATVLPRTILFGDTIRARVDVFLDRRRIEPASVRVSSQFVPWEIVGQPTRVRRDSTARTHLQTTFTLRCTSSPCLPADDASALEFDAGRVSYAAPGAAPGARQSLPIDWPVLLVYSRFAAANLDVRVGATTAAPFRADLETLPQATYRLPPGLLVGGLAVLAGLLAVAGAALAVLAIPRRERAPEPEPEPEPIPVIVLTPLEQALELLEDAERADGVEERRRALELVAEVLDLEHPELARAARTLAWSEDDPVVEQTSGLATRVRGTIDAHGNGNGRVV